MRNCNRYDARTDIWHASFATEWKIVQTIKIVGNIGIDTNQDKGSITDPAFVLGGIIYSPAPWIELDAGLRWGLNEQGRDGSVTVGVTLHF
jgi:hypothetical protein